MTRSASWFACALLCICLGPIRTHSASLEVEQRVSELRAVAEANPYDARAARRLAFALREADRLDEARAWFEKVVRLNGESPGDMYNLACLYAVTGDIDRGLDWLEKALDYGFTEDDTILKDSDMDPLRTSPRFQQITGLYPPKDLTRDQRWRYDLDFMVRRMERMHWDLYAHISKTEFTADIASIEKDVAHLSDSQVRARIRRLLARVGDGHTLMRSRTEDETTVARFPLDLYRFTDGIFVRGAAPEHAALVGARVMQLGPISADSAYTAMKQYLSVDNEIGYRDGVGSALSSPDVLEAIGALRAGDNLHLTVQGPDGRAFAYAMAPTKIDAEKLGHQRLEGFVYANDGARTPLPAWLRNPDTPLWYEYDSDQDLVYCWLGAIDDMQDKSFGAFCAEMLEFIEKNQVERLVIDMRLNAGGNTGVVLPLIHGLVKSRVNREGSLFVIIGRRTFSAAMNTCALLEMHTEATFVGEPTGSRPNFVGESTSFVLPCTHYRVFCSSRYWQHVSSEDRRPWIAPRIVAELSSQDFATNRDPAMEAILHAIAQQLAN
jgi:tetratricopeptide (TPR) repeat protein